MSRSPKAAVAWSGGKDAALAWRQAVDAGLPVASFLTMCEADGAASKSHALAREVLAAQARAAGVACRAVAVPEVPGGYAAAFDAALAALAADGHTHLVFGDIDLQAHRDWLEPACARAGLAAVFPLWGRPRAEVAQAVIAAGIRARLVCVDTRWLAPGFAGRSYDAALLAALPAGVCPAGEGGEFHTVVVDAPGFAAPLDLAWSAPQAVASRPPLAPTTLVYVLPRLTVEASGSGAAR